MGIWVLADIKERIKIDKLEWIKGHGLGELTYLDFNFLIRTIERQREEIIGLRTLFEGEKDLREATDDLLKEARGNLRKQDHHNAMLRIKVEELRREIEQLEGKLEEKFPFLKSPIRVIEFSECEHEEKAVENGIEYCDICGLIFDSKE